MKGCNTLTLCPAQMHEAVEFWLKNQFLAPRHAARVGVVGVTRQEKVGSGFEFEIRLREKGAPPLAGQFIPVDLRDGEDVRAAVDRAAKEAAASDPTSAAVERFDD